MSETLIKVVKILGPIVVLIGLVLSINIVLNPPASALLGVGLVGLVTFTFVLFGVYLMTKEWDFGQGEFRKAITVSIIAVFFALLAFGDKIVVDPSTILGEVLKNFWAILVTVIGFYFAARVADNKIDASNDSSTGDDTESAGGEPDPSNLAPATPPKTDPKA